jgi:hypothetical protein
MNRELAPIEKPVKRRWMGDTEIDSYKVDGESG